ncbi:unnamed protein product [Pipistrellus nathusii]|uniref:Secreted protein n=1 Tax=Pipistrellus nathusii TaxID=59473 RepID=A0ABN9ZVN3_PIPNA
MPSFVTSSPCSQQVLFFFFLPLFLSSFFCSVFIHRRTPKWLPREDSEALGALPSEERPCGRDFFGKPLLNHLYLPAPLRPASLCLPPAGSKASPLEVRGPFAGFGRGETGRTSSSSR